MGYLSIKQTSEKWGVSRRRIQVLCSGGAYPWRYKDWVVLGYSRRSRKAIRYAFDFWPICRLEKKRKEIK